MAKVNIPKTDKKEASTQPTPLANEPKKRPQINWAEVEEEKESLESTGGKSWKQQDLKPNESEVIRLLLPESAKFFHKLVGFWINKRFFLSRKSFGQPCELFAEYQQALNSKDRDVKSRMAANEFFNLVEKELFVGLRLNIKYDDDDEIIDIKVKGGTANFIELNKSTAQQVFNYASMRENMAGTAKQSILHREKGKNLSISRKGTGKSTEYAVTLLDRMDLMDDKFDTFYNEVPEISDYLETQLKDEQYSAAVLKNYLYDEDIPDDFMDLYEADYQEEDKPKTKSKFGKSSKSGTGKTNSSKSLADDLDDE